MASISAAILLFYSFFLWLLKIKDFCVFEYVCPCICISIYTCICAKILACVQKNRKGL